MKIALISDIHSNIFYLEECFNKIRKLKVDAVYCLGDIIGYYDNPKETIRFVRDNKIQCLKGNHEKYLLKELEYDKNKENLYGIEKQRKMLSYDEIGYLKNLPNEIEIIAEESLLYLTHSLPNNCTKYIKEVQELGKDFLLKYDYYCFGHNHIPLITSYLGVRIINPGSIGQPRDYTRLPSFVIIDTIAQEIVLVKVKVNYLSYSKSLSSKGFDSKLIEILGRSCREKN